MLRTVYLHGEAGKLFGRRFRLDVESLGEAVRAIGCQVPGFRAYLNTRDFQCVRGRSRKTGMELSEHQITFGLGSADLHIVPVIHGSGGKAGGIGKIIAGVLLAGVSFFAAPALAAIGLTGAQGIMMGLGLVVAGVSAVLSAQKEPSKNDKKDESFGFSGTVQVGQQGAPLPLIYGHTIVKQPIVASASIVSYDIAIG